MLVCVRVCVLCVSHAALFVAGPGWQTLATNAMFALLCLSSVLGSTTRPAGGLIVVFVLRQVRVCAQKGLCIHCTRAV